MASAKHENPKRRSLLGETLVWSIGFACGMAIAVPAHAEFSSSSTGADGPLTFDCPTAQTIEWEPPANVDQEDDNVFEFTTVTIPQNCTVKLTARTLGQAPLIWLATGDVVINGTLDLSGANGHASGIGGVRSPAIPGPGGFAGGPGATFGQTNALPGYGPGAGGIDAGTWGAGAGHFAVGQAQFGGEAGGRKYGSSFLIPLLGGSGGGGSPGGGGGGAGGGAILIASSSSIRVEGPGVIRADGGSGGGSGGGGSGGAIRLVAPQVAGNGVLSARFGSGANAGSGGRIRIESTNFTFNGTSNAAEVRAVPMSPSTVIRDQIGVTIPTLRVIAVDDEPVPAKPSGGFSPADVTINAPDPVLVELQAEHVPVGTIVTIEVHHDTLGTSTFDSPPLAGTEALSSAAAMVPIDPGFSLVTLRADWSPEP